jgi:hypothetical protein
VFTGIVEEVGRVVTTSATALTVECGVVLGDLSRATAWRSTAPA